MVHGSEKYCCYCILFVSLVITCNANQNHQNYTIYKLVAFNKRDRQILYFIHEFCPYSHFLNGITNEAAIPMHIAVEEEYMDNFEDLLNHTADALYTKYHKYHYVPRKPQQTYEVTDDSIVHTQFNDFPTIQNLYMYWETRYPYIFKKIIIGNTQEQNDIIILKVNGKIPEGGQKNPAVFFLGGEEGRDWISPALVLAYLKNHLQGDFGELGTRYDAYFLPVLNPDGYTYSLHHDRFWAKNRRNIHPKIMCPDHSVAKGTNIDRNWLYKGDIPCRNLYLGHYLSENETSSLSDFLNGMAPHTLAFFNVRGFDNLITTPFADVDKRQSNIDTIKELLHQTCQDINDAFGKSFYYGITASILFNNTGNCADWVKEQLNVPVVATFYMKHLDNVIPDESDIQQLYVEFAASVQEILTLTIDLYEPLFKSQATLKINNSSLLLINMCFIFRLVYF